MRGKPKHMAANYLNGILRWKLSLIFSKTNSSDTPLAGSLSCYAALHCNF